MIIVEIKDGESIDRALRRFKKKFERLGILKTVRRRMYYTPPSLQRKEALKKARRRQRYFDAQEQ